MNFLDLKGKRTEYSNARVAILSAPYEATCSYGLGASKGPEAIIRASRAAELYDEELHVNLEDVGIATLPPALLEGLEPEEMVEEVYRMALPVVQDGKIITGLGGEHTVTLGFLKAVLQGYPNLTVLQIDAHPDMRDLYEGRKICHATVGRRIQELCPLVQVGLRAFSYEEMTYLETQLSTPRAAVRPFSSYFIQRNPDWIQKALVSMGEDVYVTLDVDGLDPSLIPHTGTPEPDGLSWREVCSLLAAISSAKRIVGFDLVELTPDTTSRSSDFIAARLCIRLIGHCIGSKREMYGPPF